MDLENMGAKNTLLLTDPKLVDLSPVKVAAEALTRSKKKFTIFDKCKIEPTDNSFKVEYSKF